MAIRQEELLVREAVVYRFPSHMLAARRARAARVRRRRSGLGIVSVVTALALLMGGQAGGADRTARTPERVVVQPGQTLWDIAARHAPDRMDPRAYLDLLQELNGLEGPVGAGTRLRLP